ncbi:HAD hydrolase-like protein [Pontibacillus yanchengensis]|uniref:HAD hydrolase-like protein n=2 Tax=Pontibacillus yanchengensis TaxID=462910 RepID=A0ACC7VAS2_9BACI|nr:HAD hydrolase-like protein [Pontibacillus yanchengensis]MYL32850.1 HAD hydrolase-like protein [Pontibacillus yanchengensis]MYL51762.1 HAD hydrolase-like protein [Pontibacillus yanchengensis]
MTTNKTILFDVDGVLLSEERYFDSSALTVWEMLYSKEYIGVNQTIFNTNLSDEEITQVRSTVFDNDRVLSFIKSRGINANWDMVYLTLSHQIIVLLQQIQSTDEEFVREFLSKDITLDSLLKLNNKVQNSVVTPQFHTFVEDFEEGEATKQELLTFLNEIAYKKLGVKTESFTRNSELWTIGRQAFQEWYVGDELIEKSIGKKAKQPGKKGFIQHEIPLAKEKELQELFQQLQSEKWTIGVGTGRPKLETIEPLRALGLLDYIEEERIVTASDVLEAEEAHPKKAPLAKPQPYTYIRSWLTKQSTIQQALEFTLPINEEKIFIVGDSVADGLAAQTMGATFVAVLTGLSGKKARPDFEKMNADYIIDNVVDLSTII